MGELIKAQIPAQGAKQNAKRLHGAWLTLSSCTVPVLESGIQYNSMAKQNKQKKGNNVKQRKPRAAQVNPYLAAVTDPFNSPSCSIPDERTIHSGKCTTRQIWTDSWGALAGTSTTHSGGIIVMPYPWNPIYALVETNAGTSTLTDVTATGTAYVASRGLPAYSSLYGGSSANAARIRLVGAGLSCTYEGTELNRAGRISMGVITVADQAQCVPASGTKASPLSTLVGSSTSAVTTILGSYNSVTSSRTPDGTVVGHWIPSGVPSYQLIDGQFPGSGIIKTDTCSPGVGFNVSGSMFNSPVGSGGTEGGQNALVCLIEGDSTAAAQSFGNTYRFELIMHWEVVPDYPLSVVYSLSESKYNVALLQQALNAVGRAPVGAVVVGQSTFSNDSAGFDMGSLSQYLPSGRDTARFTSQVLKTLLMRSIQPRQMNNNRLLMN